MFSPKMSLQEVIEAPLETVYKEISQKVSPMELPKNMNVAIYTMHPHIIIKYTLTTLQEEMVVLEV